MMTPQPLLRMTQITKTFPGITALDHVEFELTTGEIHALLGANGAGKSTLMKILCGSLKQDAGEIMLDGRAMEFDRPADSIAAGISYVPQELMLAPTLSAARNILLGQEPIRFKALGIIDEKALKAQAQEIIDRLGMQIDINKPVQEHAVSTQQMIAIATALFRDSKILILDEPTSSLSEAEIERLFQITRKLRDDGHAIVFISHHLDEVFRIADRLTVLRDGVFQGCFKTSDVTQDELVALMVGRRMNTAESQSHDAGEKEVALRVHDLRADGVRGISFEVRKGEVVGIFGQVGSGRTEVLRSVFGADRAATGLIEINGKPVQIRKPQDAISHGIGFITEDRKRQGLVLQMSIADNISLGNFKPVMKRGFLDQRARNEIASEYKRDLQIKMQEPTQWVKFLSGGNQQKVILAKWLNRHSKILLMDAPTKGIDVGAKQEFYTLINALAEQGVAILMVSSELPEIMMLSDRILVMKDGTINGEFIPERGMEEQILAKAL